MFQFENLPNDQDGADFKRIAMQLIKQHFTIPQRARHFNKHQERIQRTITGNLANAGYIYNDANMWFSDKYLEVRGSLTAVYGPAGDATTLDQWAHEPMICKFTIPAPGGLIEAIR